MGRNTILKSIGLALVTTSLLSTSAIAGGFDRGGVNIDQLFDTDRFGASAQVTYVFADRVQRNIQRSTNAAGAFLPPGAPGASSAEVNGSVGFFVPRFGYKQKIGENTNCLFSYSEPFGADQENGVNNALSASSVEFSIDTQDYGVTCSYGFSAGSTSVGDSSIKIIGGVSYQEFQGFLSRQSFQDFANIGIADLSVGPVGAGIAGSVAAGFAGTPLAGAGAIVTATDTSGLGTFSVDGNSVGWRAGVAYEIPDIALRASIVYNSAYDYSLSGIQDNTGFGVDPTAANALASISADTEIPQSLDVKFQSGIAEGTLAFLNLKWQDWSQLGSIPINGGVTATAVADLGVAQVALPTTLAFEPLYRDGYTVTAGIGKVFTEKLSGLASITWDRGTSTTIGSQSDTWTLSGGLNYKSDERLDIRVGGAVGVLTGGRATGVGAQDAANLVSFEFDADLLLAVNGGLKLKF